MRVYVAGPYTQGDVAVNVRNAILAGDELIGAGHEPFLPHLSHFQHLLCPRHYETWMRLDLSWLATCAALVRLPGDSSGADREVAQAVRIGLPVFFSVQELLAVHPGVCHADL